MKNAPRFASVRNGKENLAALPPHRPGEDSQELAERVGQYMLCVPECLAWWAGGIYDGHSLRRKGSNWLLVVRMTMDSTRVVSFTRGGSIGEVFSRFATGIVYDLVQWRADQYE